MQVGFVVYGAKMVCWELISLITNIGHKINKDRNEFACLGK